MRGGHVDVVKHLLELPTTKTLKLASGTLHNAINKDSANMIMIQLLLNHGQCDPFIGLSKDSAFHEACEAGNWSAVTMMLKHTYKALNNN